MMEDKKNFLSDLHRDLIADLHEARRNFIQLIIPIIAGMAVFGYGLEVFLNDPGKQETIFFTVTTGGAIILLLIVIYTANICGYSYRQSQVMLYKIEDLLDVTRRDHKDREDDKDLWIIPQDWNPCKNREKKDLPEIFKFFKILALWMIVIIIVVYGYALYTMVFQSTSLDVEKFPCVFIILVAALIIALMGHLFSKFQWGFCEKSYRQKLITLCNDLKRGDQ